MPESDYQPYALSKAEWREIANLPDVREAWGLNEETGEDFAEIAYGVKFKFVSGHPGYIGDLYILQGDTLTDDPPWQFIREGGKLKLI
jgi:hypothetical protein